MGSANVIRDSSQQALLSHLKTLTRGFDGARSDRMTQTWNPGNASADVQIRMDGRVLRERARDLVQNNGFGKGALNAIVANTIGTGIKPMPQIEDRDQRQAWRDAWNYWAEFEADVTGHQHFYELSALALKEIVPTGELLLRYVWFTPQEMRRDQKAFYAPSLARHAPSRA